MTNLNNINSPISREERNKLNENWQLLTQRFSQFQGHLNLLAGEDVEGIITNINERIAETDIALQQIETDLVEVNGAADNANAKAEIAQTAADIAEQITALAQEKVDFIEEHEEDIVFFTSMQNNLQAQVNQLVVSGDSSPEAAQARVDVDDITHSTLKSRIDNDVVKINQKIDSEIGHVAQQLAQSTKRMNTELIPHKEVKAIQVFIDDDGRTAVLDKWTSILEEKKIPLCVAVITSFVGNSSYMTWEQLKQLRDTHNVELLNHTHTHQYTGTLSDEEIYNEFKTSSDILRQHGGTPEIMVYPYGSNSASVRRIGRQFFRGAFAIRTDVTNVPPIDTFGIARVALAEETNNTLEYYKSKIDEAIANNQMLVWMSHSQYESFDATQIQHIKDLIDYANSKGVRTVNASEALDIFGNILDIGDMQAATLGAEYTVIGADGKIKSNVNSFDAKIFERSDGIDVNTPITAFEPKKTSFMLLYASAQFTGMPENTSGVLETFRPTQDAYGYQIYYTRISNNVYKRVWSGTRNEWGEFQPLSLSFVSPRDAYTGDSLPSEFLEGRITHTQISSANSKLSTFPDSAIGILVTSRLFPTSTGANYVYQEYHAYNGKMFRRAFQGASWTAWTVITQGVEKVRFSLPETVVPEKTSVEVSGEFVGLTTSQAVWGSPNIGIVNGVMYNVMCKSNGQVTVRYYNYTDAPITLTARNWTFAKQ